MTSKMIVKVEYALIYMWFLEKLDLLESTAGIDSRHRLKSFRFL